MLTIQKLTVLLKVRLIALVNQVPYNIINRNVNNNNTYKSFILGILLNIIFVPLFCLHQSV